MRLHTSLIALLFLGLFGCQPTKSAETPARQPEIRYYMIADT